MELRSFSARSAAPTLSELRHDFRKAKDEATIRFAGVRLHTHAKFAPSLVDSKAKLFSDGDAIGTKIQMRNDAVTQISKAIDREYGEGMALRVFERLDGAHRKGKAAIPASATVGDLERYANAVKELAMEDVNAPVVARLGGSQAPLTDILNECGISPESYAEDELKQVKNEMAAAVLAQPKGTSPADCKKAALAVLLEHVKDKAKPVEDTVRGWGETNKGYHTKQQAHTMRIGQIAQEIASIGDDVAASRTQGTLDRLTKARAALDQAMKDARASQGEQDKWYLGQGARAGVAPLYKKAGIDPKALDEKTRTGLAKALHEISVQANQVKEVLQMQEVTAQVLELQLTILQARLAEPDTAAKTAREHLEKAAAWLDSEADRILAMAKLPKTERLMVDLKEGNAVKSPEFLSVEIDSNNTRLASIPKWRKLVDARVSGFKDAVPAAMRAEKWYQDLAARLDNIGTRHDKNVSDAQKMLEACNVLIEAKRKQAT
jgi:hypothetical protein